MRKLTATLAVVSVLASAALCGAASAEPIRFDIRWSGASFNNPATATGFVVIDAENLENGLGYGVPLPDPRVLELQITVTGAQSGNGTFMRDDYDSMHFYTPGSLDLSRELIGQPLDNGFTFGPAPSSEPGEGDGDSGDFNFFSNDADVPSGFWFFEISAAGSSGGDALAITSIVAHVIPEPTSLATFALGSVLLLAWRRRRAVAGR